MNVAQYLIARLMGAGLGHLFAVPGDYASPFLETLDATTGIERVPNINELGSGYAADGYARFKGIGAACIQYGVGTFSALNCAAGAYVERVPVAFISASPSTSDRARARTQGILFHHATGNFEADRNVFANVTVASEIISDPKAAAGQIDRAIVAMLTHRRPIYLEVLKNVWSLECGEPVGALTPVAQTSDPTALAAFLETAWGMIEAAQRPLIWAGVLIQRFGLSAALQGLVDASGLGFTTTSLGKTVLDEGQAQFIGTYAGPASPPATNAAVLASDCLITLGAIITDDYLDIMAQSFGSMILVDDQVARVGSAYFHGVIMADALAGLTARFAAGPVRKGREPPPAPLADDADLSSGAPLTYNLFYRQLTDYLAAQGLLDEVVLILGESTSLYVFGNYFGLPAESFVGQAAWGSLGHETGAALGVALGSGKRPFVVAGDGGFMMVCQELSSLAEAGIPAAVFVMSNQGYAIEQAFVDLKAFTPQGSFAPFDVLPKWDYLALAQAFGAQGFRVATSGALAEVLGEVRALTDTPALIEVVIPHKDLAPQLARLAGAPPMLRKYQRG